MRKLRAANISDAGESWPWILDRVDRLDISIFSAVSRRRGRAPGAASFQRLSAALKLRRAFLGDPFDVVVSHRPLLGAWTSAALGRAKGAARHLNFAFNFTDLPRGPRRALLTRAFRAIDEFAVFTNHERDLYADYFAIPREKLFVVRWGVRAPIASPGPRRTPEPYLAALGGEARDYRTLCAAARLLPEARFMVVARPANVAGLKPPPNVTVLIDLPYEDAWSIVAHAQAAILPLRNRDTPCGIVTLVGAMHLGKAQIVTAAAGVGEYVQSEHNALLVPERDPEALAAAAQRLISAPQIAARLGSAAKKFAERECSEAATIRFFEARLAAWFPELSPAKTPA